MIRKKRVYTSYFAGYRGDEGVSIARWAPKYFSGRSIPSLAPTKRIMHMPPKEYVPAYTREILGKIDEKQVLSEIHDGDVLLCWEPPLEFCHRHLVAEWLKGKGLDVSELGQPEKLL